MGVFYTTTGRIANVANFIMGDVKQQVHIQAGSTLLSVTHKHGFIALFVLSLHILPISGTAF